MCYRKVTGNSKQGAFYSATVSHSDINIQDILQTEKSLQTCRSNECLHQSCLKLVVVYLFATSFGS